MSRHYILYNPLAGGGFSSEKEKKVKKLFLGKDNEFLDITEINYSDFLKINLCLTIRLCLSEATVRLTVS